MSDGACSQYVTWSRDSRYLAASSDSNRTVTVWDLRPERAQPAHIIGALSLLQAERPQQGDQGGSDVPQAHMAVLPPFLALEDFRRPVLAVIFLPSSSAVLACAEDHGRITLIGTPPHFCAFWSSLGETYFAG